MMVFARAALVAVLVWSAIPAAAETKRSLMKQFEDEFIQLSEQVRPSVVEISARGTISENDQSRMNDLFRFFGRPQPEDENKPPENEDPKQGPRSTASGFIFDRLGHIVTNNHVVKDAEFIQVELWDGTIHDAVVVGQDPEADLAVVRIDPTGLDLKPVQLAHSDTIRVGQFAVAMGSPSGLTGSFSYGHVTGLGRDSLNLPDRELRFQQFIQTDAAINLGNSGGPLCNIDGEVIGVNVAIVYRANSLGFAIPVRRVRDVVPQLIAQGKVVRGWLGVSVNDVDDVATSERQELDDFMEAHALPDAAGSYVRGVTPNGPAERGDLQPDDVIRQINGKAIANSTHLIDTVSDIDPGDAANLVVWRRGEAVSLKITVGEFPGRMAAIYGRAYLGMHLTELELNPEFMQERGMEKKPADYFVVAIVPGGPAEKAGIRRGDIILEIAYEDTTSMEKFTQVLRDKAHAGKTLLVKVWTLSDDEPRKVYLKVPDTFEAP